MTLMAENHVTYVILYMSSDRMGKGIFHNFLNNQLNFKRLNADPMSLFAIID